MIYTTIDTFYLTYDQLKNSPSLQNGIDEATETTLRIHGCDLIQEACILLRLPQAVIATAQVLFHRFYCKQSFSRFNVKQVAASCVWLASKLEEDPRKGKHVVMVFHRMKCRRENLPIRHLDLFSGRYTELKKDLTQTERHLLKEMGFICHVEHPHKFISNYLAALGMPPELRQEAWNLANDSLRTSLCVRFRSEVIACGVVYAAARRFQVPLPENPPWWEAFDADTFEINEVCRVLAHLYSLPKAQYIPVCREGEPFTSSNRNRLSPAQPGPKEGLQDVQAVDNDTITPTDNPDSGGLKDLLLKEALVKQKEAQKNDDAPKTASFKAETRGEPVPKYKADHGTEASQEKNKEPKWERERERERERWQCQ